MFLLAKYNYKQLTENTYWKVDEFENSDVCLITNSCNIYFRLCSQLPQEISKNCGPSSGICINNGGTFYNLGNYNNATPALVEKADKSGFMSVYRDGDSEFLGCPNTLTLTTTLNFICNKSAEWKNDQTEHHGELPFDVVYDMDECTAVFNFNYNGSCFTPIIPIVLPSVFNVPILFIVVAILLFLFLTYWLVGFVFNIASGKRGEEVIPNHKIWKYLSNLFIGGFLFVFQLFSCKKAAKTGDEEPIVKKGYQTIDNAKYPFGP